MRPPTNVATHAVRRARYRRAQYWCACPVRAGRDRPDQQHARDSPTQAVRISRDRQARPQGATGGRVIGNPEMQQPKARNDSQSPGIFVRPVPNLSQDLLGKGRKQAGMRHSRCCPVTRPPSGRCRRRAPARRVPACLGSHPRCRRRRGRGRGPSGRRLLPATGTDRPAGRRSRGHCDRPGACRHRRRSASPRRVGR